MSQTYSSGSLTFSADTWKHLTVTIDSIEKKIVFFENGIQVATSNLTNGFIPNISGINIGAKSNATDGITNYFDGELDNVMIHNRILDLDEIKILSESKFPTIQNANTWVHVGASYDTLTNNVAIYKNGAKVGESTSQSVSLPNNTNEMKIGSNLNGLIDNFAMYERKLSDDEFKILGNIKRYEGDFYNSKSLINCNFNDVISINKNFRGKYFMLEYIENYGDISYVLNDVDFYENDVDVYEKNIREITNSAKFFELTEISNISKIIVNNVDANTAIKRVGIYYSESLPVGKTLNDITIEEFKAHSIFAQVFHLNKGSGTNNEITDNLAVDVSGNGIHGSFALDPIKSSTNHYGGTYNKSVEIGGLQGNNNSIVFSGEAFSNLDFSESYMSSWINTPVLNNDMCIFKKTDNFEFKLNKTTNTLSAEYYDTVASQSNLITSSLSVANDTWTNIGVHFNKQNNNVTFFKKTTDSVPAESDVHSNINLAFNNSVQTDLKCFIDKTSDDDQKVFIDNLRIELGHFHGINKFYEIADSNNEISINQISAGTWTHVAATYENSKGRVRMYHDGEQVGELNNYNITPTDDSNQPVFIGKYNNNIISDDTLLSDVIVYDKSFTPGQIKDLYENNKTPPVIGGGTTM